MILAAQEAMNSLLPGVSVKTKRNALRIGEGTVGVVVANPKGSTSLSGPWVWVQFDAWTHPRLMRPDELESCGWM
jgi:hypothetical protein